MKIRLHLTSDDRTLFDVNLDIDLEAAARAGQLARTVVAHLRPLAARS